MFFDELSNDEWARLSALVSDEPAVRLNRRGRPRAEPRIVANAVLWIMTTGEPWSKLPGRYPSGPTCRRRFEEWQANGTLLEMVRLLSETGRTFAYIPEPTPPVAVKPAPEAEQPVRPRDDAVRGVFWKSPESWQTASGTPGVTNGWRPLGAIADITRQLAGAVDEASLTNEIVPSAHADFVGSSAEAESREAKSLSVAHAHRQADASDDEYSALYDGHQHGAALAQDDASDSVSAPEGLHQQDEFHAPLWMNLAMPGGAQFSDERGYVIYAAAEQVASTMYRAWAEIMRDGRRIERSGLIGPRFDDAEAARRFALAWATEWIDREAGVTAAHATGQQRDGAAVAERTRVVPHAAAAPVQQTHAAQRQLPAYAGAPAASQAAGAAPVTRPMPESAAAKSAVPGAVNRNGNGATPSSATSSYPQHTNAHRLQLRRYPSESSAAADKTTDRFPPTRKFLSHVR
ncbi:transposase [Paraburkholderia rhizosphaerae]|uniref:Transposase n=1 Tax=Paraburkholderia rhizosphaerae TaxID=480658 RepID=A0A4R8LX91_9BURK|nr:transposase [Paraburkholderia rhizosphaerae]TDY52820.1 transposase [Paraburkholderia rhizosphaerae]